MAELGVGYISIVPEVSKINPEIRKALGGADPIAEQSGKSMGGKLSSGIGTALKRTAIGTGVAAGGLIATGLTKGFGRLDAIESAQSKLTGLGNSAETVSGVMDSALNAVKGTAHGLGEAATVASQMVASGIKPGEELEQTLKTVGDTAAIAGRSMEDVGLIFGSVAARGKLQGDDMLQLMSSGIPVLQLLSEELGVTSEEVSDMVSEGKVDFATFEAAMREGMGGAALEMGDTFRGALANMGAAAGRVGATALDPFFDLTKDGFGVATEALDNFNDRLGPQMDNLADWLQNRGVPALKDFAGASKALYQDVTSSDEFNKIWGNTADAVQQVWSAGKELLPVASSLIGTLGKASAALGLSSWTIFVNTLEIAGSVLEATAKPLEVVADFLEDHPGLVMAAVGAWGAFKTLPGIAERLASAFSPVTDRVGKFNEGLDESIRYAKFFNPELDDMGARLEGTKYHFEAIGRSALDGERNFDRFANGTQNVIDALGGPWMMAISAAGLMLAGVIDANKRVEDAQNMMAEAARNSAAAQTELEAAVAGTTGALSEQALEAASAVAENELANFVATGEALSGFFKNTEKMIDDYHSLTDSQQREEEKRLIQLGDAYDMVGGKLEEQGFKHEDLARIVAEGGKDYQALIDSLDGQTMFGNTEVSDVAIQQLEAARDEIDRMVEAARELDPAAAQAAAGIDVLADSAASGEDKLSALESVMQAMGLAPKDAERAMMEASESIDKVVESVANAERPIEEMGDALFDMQGKLDWSNGGAKDLSDALSEMSDELNNVAVNGGDTSEIFESKIAPALELLQEEFGLTDEQMAQLRESYGLMPEVVSTLVSLEGAGETLQSLADVYTGLYDIPVGKEIKVAAPTDEARAALEELGIEVSRERNGQVTISARTEEAKADLEQFTNLMAEVGETDIEPVVFLNADPLRVSADEAKAIVDALDIEEPTPQAKMIIDDLLNGKGIAQGELDALGAMSPTPTADLNKSLLDNGVSLSNESLNALSARRATPVVSANVKPFESAINWVKEQLNRLPGVNVAIGGTVRSGSGGSSAFASGGRLPTTGPGTGTVDGFLGVNGEGMPIARVDAGEWVINRRNSERYNRELAAINAGTFPKLPGYADGGKVSAGQLLNLAKGNGASRSLEGAPYVWGGINWGDCSGAMSALARFASGLSAFGGRFATGNQREALNAMGANSGLGSGARFSMGWFNGGPYGGHTSGTIHFGDGRSVNVEMGGGRGNGQIGGNAAPASHPQYTNHAHIPLRGGAGVLVDEFGVPIGIDSTSVDGYTTKAGRSVSWGEAQDLYDQALEYARRQPGFNMGGRHDGYRLPGSGRGTGKTDGFLAVNHSGMPIARLDANEWIINGRSSERYDRELAAINAGTFPKLPGYALGGRIGSVSDMPGYEVAIGKLDPYMRRFEKAVDDFAKQADDAQGQAVMYGSTFGGDWLGEAKIVRDAEQGLLDLRRAIAEENDDVVEREKELKEAREELRKAEKEGGALSVSQRRKLEDAEAAVAKARKDGKPDKIADAEKRLARAREDADTELAKSKDKNAETVKRAQDKVNKAEDNLAEAREVTTDQSVRLAAAERTIAAARYQAAGEIASGAFDALSKGASSLGEFFDEMARLAQIVENTRQAVAKLQMQQQMNAIERLRSLNELQVKEWDVSRTRFQGAISVAQAEADLEDARELAALKGATGIEAMSGAMDRFRETGKFAVGDVAQSVIDNSNEVKAAEWAVYIARAKANLDEFEATRAQAVAQLQVAQATLNQTAAAEMLQLQTMQLQQQTAQLYGMTANQATGASKGFGGLGKALGGVGKLAGGIMAGLAGFAVGGPLGALAGAGLAIGGLSDLVKGGIDVATNKDDMKDAWKELDTGSKAGVILGGVGGLAAGVAGGAGSTQFGPEFALGMADIGGQITEATIGSVQYSIAERIDKINRDAEDQMAALQRRIDQSQFELDYEKATQELEELTKRDTLEADVKYGEMMRESFLAANEKVAQAYRDAAESEAKRAGIAHDEQIGELTKSNEYLARIDETLRGANSGNDEVVKELATASKGITGILSSIRQRSLSGADANAFVDSRI